MPVLYILIFLGALLLFFLLSFIYKPLGKLTKKIFGDSIDIMKEKDSDNVKEK